MEIKKENNKYYVNGLNLEEVIANRKHIMKYIDFKINECERLLNNKNDETAKLIIKTRLKVIKEIQRELKLRK